MRIFYPFHLFLKIIIFLLLLAMPASAEFLFLKNGKIIEGKVISETPMGVAMVTNDNKNAYYARADVMRLLYTQLYMGRLYVNLTNGQVISVYMVDEDQQTYTFRKKLDSPEEFKVVREEVLFMARQNPTGLTEKLTIDYVDLKWNAPYNPVKYYKIYTVMGTEEPVLRGTTPSKNFRLTGLKSNTDFVTYVTAIDKENQESLPSNQIKFKTLNKRPFPPKKIIYSKQTLANDMTRIAHISWEKTTDPDGTVNAYVVYIKQTREKQVDQVKTSVSADRILKGYTKSAQVTEPSAEITALKPDTEYSIRITSIDDASEESSPSEEFIFITANKKPNPPDRVKIVSYTWIDPKNCNTVISWGKGKDPDGEIKEYRVYIKENKKPEKGEKEQVFKLAGTTQGNELTIQGRIRDVNYCIKVHSVDNILEESVEGKEIDFTPMYRKPYPPGSIKVGKFTWTNAYTCSVVISWGKGSAGDSVISQYRVFLKEIKKLAKGEKEPEYRIAGTSLGNEYIVQGLNKEKEYRIKVHSIDTIGNESAEGKEVEFKVVNQKPNAPNGLKVTSMRKQLNTTFTVRLEWDNSKDPDGTIKEYIVSLKEPPKKGKKETEFKLAGRTNIPQFDFIGLVENAQYSVRVTSVDNLDDMSKGPGEATFIPIKHRPRPPEKLKVASMNFIMANRTYIFNLMWDKSVSLSSDIKEYCIYLKDPDRPSKGTKVALGFVVLGKVPVPGFSVTGLPQNREYTARVTAIDMVGDESLTGSDILFNTNNRPPSRPEDLKIVLEKNKDMKSFTAKLSWKHSKDVDGKILSYDVLRRSGLKYENIKMIDETAFTITGIPEKVEQFYAVRAMDDRAGLSPRSREKEIDTSKLRMIFGMRGCYIVPIGDFANLNAYGTGGFLSILFNPLILKNFYLGIDVGAEYYSGKHMDVDYSLLVPIFFTLGYRFRLIEGFYIAPFASVGYSYYSIVYKKLETTTETFKGTTLSVYKPAFSVGLAFQYMITPTIGVRIGGEFGAMIESKLIEYIVGFAGFDYMLRI